MSGHARPAGAGARPLADRVYAITATLVAVATAGVIGHSPVQDDRAADWPVVSGSVRITQIPPMRRPSPSGGAALHGAAVEEARLEASAALGAAQETRGEAGSRTEQRRVTEQRSVINALAEGRHAQAARMYRELASRHPEQKAYGHAAAILRRQLDPARRAAQPGL